MGRVKGDFSASRPIPDKVRTVLAGMHGHTEIRWDRARKVFFTLEAQNPVGRSGGRSSGRLGNEKGQTFLGSWASPATPLCVWVSTCRCVRACEGVRVCLSAVSGSFSCVSVCYS